MCTRLYPLLVVDFFVLTLQLLEFVTDELSIRVGETLAELLNAALVRISFTSYFTLSHSSVHQNPCLLAGQCVSIAIIVDRDFILIASTCCVVLNGLSVELIVAVRKTYRVDAVRI